MPNPPSRYSSAIAFGVIFGITAFVYVGSGIVTASSVGTWYQTLSKPSFNPPDWLFAPVWTVLYLMMALAGWLAWRRARSGRKPGVFAAYGIQLGLNCLWSILFFGLQWIGVALIEIILLFLSILWTACVFWPIDWRAAMLLVPYAFWVAYAVALNGAIWWLN